MVSSRMLESYCADIENLLRKGTVRSALTSSVALPDICSALEEAHMQGSPERYAAWCARWLKWNAAPTAKALDGARLYRLHVTPSATRPTSPSKDSPTTAALARLRKARRTRAAQSLGRRRVWLPSNRLEAFRVNLSDALVEAARRWYREVGTTSPVVQQNLGRLLIS